MVRDDAPQQGHRHSGLESPPGRRVTVGRPRVRHSAVGRADDASSSASAGRVSPPPAVDGVGRRRLEIPAPENGAVHPVLGQLHLPIQHVDERAGGLERRHEAVDGFEAPAQHPHRHLDHARLDVRTHLGHHHVRRQGGFDTVEEVGPRERPLGDQGVGLAGRVGQRREFLRSDGALRLGRAGREIGGGPGRLVHARVQVAVASPPRSTSRTTPPASIADARTAATPSAIRGSPLVVEGPGREIGPATSPASNIPRAGHGHRPR